MNNVADHQKQAIFRQKVEGGGTFKHRPAPEFAEKALVKWSNTHICPISPRYFHEPKFQ